MFKAFRISFVFLILSTIVFGFVYPGLISAIVQTLFPHQTEGSLIKDKDGKIMGSELIGQAFTKPQYFWSRPSATTPAYNAASSSGSNFSVNNPALKDAVVARIKALHDADPNNTKPVPVDLITASGSGLDPHISIAAADYQMARVARVRGLDIDKLRSIVKTYTTDRQFGFLGEPVVNVLPLNLALDGRLPADGQNN